MDQRNACTIHGSSNISARSETARVQTDYAISVGNDNSVDLQSVSFPQMKTQMFHIRTSEEFYRQVESDKQRRQNIFIPMVQRVPKPDAQLLQTKYNEPDSLRGLSNARKSPF